MNTRSNGGDMQGDDGSCKSEGPQKHSKVSRCCIRRLLRNKECSSLAVT